MSSKEKLLFVIEVIMQLSNNGYYRAYFKHRMFLTEAHYAVSRVLSFNVRRDILGAANSSFLLEKVPDAVVEGDVIILLDPFGTEFYTGVVRSINNDDLDCVQILGLFDDVIKTKIEYWAFNAGFIAIKLLKEYGGIFSNPNVSINTNDTLSNRFISQFDMTKDNSDTTIYTVYAEEEYNLEKLMIEIYSAVGTLASVKIGIGEGRPIIKFENSVAEKIKIIDNTVIVPTIDPIVEVADANKLVVLDQDGLGVRAIRYLTDSGISTDPSDLTRLQVVKTKYVESDVEIDAIISTELSKELYSHKIEVTMILDNKLYDFFEFELGGEFDIFIKGKYYNTILTGYELNKEVGRSCEEVKMIFGKVRTRATQRFFS